MNKFSSKRLLTVYNCSKKTKAMNRINSRKFKKMIKNWGANLVGFGDVTEGLAWEFKHLPTAISLAIVHPNGEDSIINNNNSVIAYTNQYPLIDASLENIQKRIVSYLRSLGWKAFAIPPDTGKIDPSFVARLFPLFPHKTAATCSGLGWVGKNGLLVTRQYGARLSWATVLTDAPLEVSEHPYLRSECKSCRRCVEACPAGAVYGVQWSRDKADQPLINVDKCSEQLAYHAKVIGKMICAHCIVACPVGRERRLYISKQCNINKKIKEMKEE